MNVGLLFVVASIYQMTRGALVLFVGLFSVLFLRRKLYAYHWISLVIVVLGVGVVGLAGALFPSDEKDVSSNNSSSSSSSAVAALSGHSSDTIKAEDDHSLEFWPVDETHSDSPLSARAVTTSSPNVLSTVVGICLIAFAQVFTATQFCLEEWILETYALEPLRVVAWEGVFGFSVTILLQFILHLTVGRHRTTSPVGDGRGGASAASGDSSSSSSTGIDYFDAYTGYTQVFTNHTIALTSIFIMISIGGFNYFGLSVTRTISATSRSIIDTCRTLFIWIVSLGLGWETFKPLQLVGFAMLVYGTFLFNDLVRVPIRALVPKDATTVKVKAKTKKRRRAGLVVPSDENGNDDDDDDYDDLEEDAAEETGIRGMNNIKNRNAYQVQPLLPEEPIEHM